MVDAEFEMDAKHGPIIRVIVDGTKVAVYLAQEIGVVTPPTNRDQYGIEVKGPWWKYRQYVETPSIDHAGDIAIPDEVVDLKLLLDCRRERDEALAEARTLRNAAVDLQAEIERLRKAITDCLDYANGRQYEWGSRAEAAFEYLEDAIDAAREGE